MSKVKVKNYTDKDILDRVKKLKSFTGFPKGFWLVGIRSNEDTYNTFDDKLYLYKGEKFIMVMPCTTHSGGYGLKNFMKWNSLGAATIKSEEIYYNVYQKTDGKRIRHHRDKVQGLRQVGDMLYTRDNNKDNKIDEVGKVYKGIYHTAVHPNDYSKRTGLTSWLVNGWSVGCVVVNNLTKYWSMIQTIPYNEKISLAILKEF